MNIVNIQQNAGGDKDMGRGKRLLTGDEARQSFRDNGISICGWARANGFNQNLVFDVLKGRRKGVRGQSYEIAVKLGIREGEITSVKDFEPRLCA